MDGMDGMGVRGRSEREGQIPSRLDCVDKGARNEIYMNNHMIDCVYLILSILLILSKLFPTRPRPCRSGRR
jgi:hypothetical protein